MLTIIEKVIFLQVVDVFSEVSTEQLAFLASVAEEQSYVAGDVFYKEKDPSDALFLVLEGKVRLHRGEQEITVIGPKEAFGTWALFDEEIRVATATALENTSVLRIDREDFYDLLSDHIEIMQAVFAALVKRLRGLLKHVGGNTAEQKQE